MKIKICLAQMEVKPGFPQKNTERMLYAIESAKRDGAEIIVLCSGKLRCFRCDKPA